MSRFCVVSEWPQISVPPFFGSSARAAPTSKPPNVAPATSVAVVLRKSLRFIASLLYASGRFPYQPSRWQAGPDLRHTKFAFEREAEAQQRALLKQPPPQRYSLRDLE